MMEKVEEFLFDILGLIIPGMVFLSLAILLPVSIIDYFRIDFSEYLVGRTPLFTYISRIMDKVTLGAFLSSWQVITIITAISYIFGHAIKVMSKFQYELCEQIFDKGVNKFFAYFSNKINNAASKKANYRIIRFFNGKYRSRIRKLNSWWIALLGILFGSFEFLSKVCRAIFKFSAPNNFEKKMQKNVAETINKRYSFLPPNWYTVYKIANVAIAQENLKSLSFKFLAKYNFYRSLALIFLLNGAYILILYNKINHLINPLGHIMFHPMLAVNFVLWFTFHEKYKRYWTLCGNESLVTLFYFLNTKGKEKKENEKKDTVS